MGNTRKPMALSFQCMTKFTTNKKKKNRKKKNPKMLVKTIRTNKFSKVSGHKINIQKSVFLYNNNEPSQR